MKSVLLNEDSLRYVKGKVIVNNSTISSDESIEVANNITSHSGKYIESPVLGSTPAATNGALQLLVGAPKSVVEDPVVADGFSIPSLQLRYNKLLKLLEM